MPRYKVLVRDYKADKALYETYHDYEIDPNDDRPLEDIASGEAEEIRTEVLDEYFGVEIDLSKELPNA